MTNISSQNQNKLSKKSQKLTNNRFNRKPPAKKSNIQSFFSIPTSSFRVKVPKHTNNYVMAVSPASKNNRRSRRRGRPSSKPSSSKRSFKEISEDEVPNDENSLAKQIKSQDLFDNEESSSKPQENHSEIGKSESNGISADSPSSKLKKDLNSDSQLDESASGKLDEDEYELKSVNSDEEEFYIDPVGETKINHDGELLGGRVYAIHTFTIPSRHPTRLYVWGSTLAKCLGATDSHKIISPYPQLKRIYPSTAPEIKDLTVTPGYGIKYNLLTARSAFLVFGYRIIRQGRVGVDDYYRYENHKPRRIKPANFKPSARTEATNLLAKSKAFFTIPPTVGSRPSLKYKSISDHEYLSQLAHETRAFNSDLFRSRIEKPVFYEPHTNLYHAPQSTQISNLRVSIVNFNPVPFALVPEVMENHNIKGTLQLQSNPDYSICGVDEDTLNLLPSNIVEEINQLKKQRDAQKPKPIANIYPIALAEGQPQSHPSFYPVRFNQNKVPSFISTLDTLNRSNGLPTVDTAGPSILPNIPKPVIPNHSYPTRTAMKSAINLSKPTSESGRFISPRDLSTKKRCGVISLKTQAPCRNFISANGKYCDNHYKYFMKTGKLDMGIDRNSPASVSVRSFNKESIADSDTEELKDDQDVYYHCLECGKPEAPESALPEEHTDDLVSSSITIKCTKCEHQYHPWCVHLHSQTLYNNILKYDWQCSDCKLCSVCNSVGIEEELLFCDSCDRAFHMKCHTPKVKEIPQGDWICHICQ